MKEIKYKHNWEVEGSPGMYDTLYRCETCGEHNMESADGPETSNPEYGCTPPKEQDNPKRLIPVVEDTGWIDLPNGCTLYWEKNEVGGRTYMTDEVGPPCVVWDTALTDQSSLLAAMTQEAALQRLERYWEEKKAKNK